MIVVRIASMLAFAIWGLVGGFLMWGHIAAGPARRLAPNPQAEVEVLIWIGGILFLGFTALLFHRRAT